MERAFEKSGADNPEVVVTAVMAALSGRRTKPRAVIGKGAGAFVLMSRLPIHLRDRLVRSALGLSEALKRVNWGSFSPSPLTPVRLFRAASGPGGEADAGDRISRGEP
jgi:hypothetical protein